MLDKYRPAFDRIDTPGAQAIARVLTAAGFEVEEPATPGQLHARIVEQHPQLTMGDITSVVTQAEDMAAHNALELMLDTPVTGPVRPITKKATAWAHETVKRSIGGDERIIHSIHPNPKRMGGPAWERYSLYKEGMSVQDYYRVGGYSRDVAWDSKQGFIQLREAGDGTQTEPEAGGDEEEAGGDDRGQAG